MCLFIYIYIYIFLIYIGGIPLGRACRGLFFFAKKSGCPFSVPAGASFFHRTSKVFPSACPQGPFWIEQGIDKKYIEIVQRDTNVITMLVMSDTEYQFKLIKRRASWEDRCYITSEITDSVAINLTENYLGHLFYPL